MSGHISIFGVFLLAPLIGVAQQPILLNHSVGLPDNTAAEPEKAPNKTPERAPDTAPKSADAVLHNSGSSMSVPFACAEDDLRMTGLFCTDDEPCPIYLELSAVTAVGKKLFLAGDLHGESATLSSILLSSDDGGATWKEGFARIRGSALDDIQFYDAEHGWAAGETQYPLPRDPFFLVSTDGGLSWRQRPVTEDGGPGSVHRFRFDSAQHGELVVDAGRSARGGRYISYESQTGGESWNVRGANGQLPAIKRGQPATDSPGYRIRADKTSKAWQIEKRLGDRWEPVASFLIQVANCRIKPPEAKGPPPEIPSADVEPPGSKEQ